MFFGFYSAAILIVILCSIFTYIGGNGLKRFFKLNINIRATILLACIILFVAFYGGLIFYLNWPIANASVEKSAQFGESFGILSSLFSGLAFGGLIWTLMLQRQDISQSKIETKNNRDMLSKQNFEMTFFNMLQMHHKIVDDFDVYNRGKLVATGRDCYKRLHRELTGRYERRLEKENEVPLVTIMYAYEALHDKWKHDLEHYFRNLYNIVKFIDQSNIAEEHEQNQKEKFKYANILAAQLSTFEVVLLFYNGLSKYGRRRAKPLIEKYSLLENMDENELLSFSFLNCYDKKAYGTKLSKKYEEA